MTLLLGLYSCGWCVMKRAFMTHPLSDFFCSSQKGVLLVHFLQKKRVTHTTKVGWHFKRRRARIVAEVIRKVPLIHFCNPFLGLFGISREEGDKSRHFCGSNDSSNLKFASDIIIQVCLTYLQLFCLLPFKVGAGQRTKDVETCSHGTFPFCLSHNDTSQEKNPSGEVCVLSSILETSCELRGLLFVHRNSADHPTKSNS